MNAIKLLVFLLFILGFQLVQAQSSTTIKQLVVDEFKREMGDVQLEGMWKSNFGLEYDEVQAVFEINSSQGDYWIIEFSDKRNPISDITITRPFMSSIARPEEVKELEAISSGYSIETKIKPIDTCEDLEKKIPIKDAPKNATVACFRTLTEKDWQERPEIYETIKKIEKKQREKRSRSDLESTVDEQSMFPIPVPTPNCTLGRWSYVRKEACAMASFEATIINIDTGASIGGFFITTTQYLTLHHQYSGFTEDFDMEFSLPWGRWQGTTINSGVECLGVCRVTSSTMPWGQVITIPGQFNARVNYDTIISSVHSFRSVYKMFTGPIPMSDVQWDSPVIRCDKVVRTNYPGCVFPGVAGFMNQMQDARIPDIRANIRNIQSVGPLHYGRLGDGNPLSRTTNDSIRRANNKAACPPPHGNPSPGSSYNCDEYPFASTYQGASQVNYPNWGSEWVSASQNNTQGGLVSGFYFQNRIMDSDYFWVDVSY